MAVAARLHRAAFLAAVLALAAPCAAGAQARMAIPRAEAGAVAAAATRPVLADVWRDAEPEQVLVELRLGRLAARTVAAYRDGDRVLLPVRALLELAEVAHEVDATGRLRATFHPGERRLLVAAASDTMRLGRQVVVARPEQKLLSDGEFYVESSLLAALLGLRITTSWTDLAVFVDDIDELPIARRLEREQVRARLAGRTSRAAGDPSSARRADRALMDGLVVDYLLSSPLQEVASQAGYGFTAGANLLGGSLEGVVSGTGSTGARAQGSWTGVWRESRWLRQLRLGDGASTGPTPRQLRGIVFGNSPFVRPAAFSLIPFPGELPPGWGVDVYRAGELVGYDSVDATGRYQLTLPVQYGDNPVDFVAWGPNGEERRFSRLYRVRGDLLAPGQVEYGASGGRCDQRRSCGGTGNADVRWGASPRLTLRAGADAFRTDSAGLGVNPYAAVAWNPRNAVALRADGALGALAHGGVAWEPSIHGYVSADYTRYAANAPLSLAPPGWRDRMLVTGFWRPAGDRGQSFVEASGERVHTGGARLDRGRLAWSLQHDVVRLVPYVRAERDYATRTMAGASAWLLTNPRWGKLLDRGSARATIEAERGRGVSQGGVTVSRQISRTLQVEATSLWMRELNGPTIAITLASAGNQLRAMTTTSLQRGQRPTAQQVLQGGLVWDGDRRRASLVRGPAVQRAGAVGRVFLDADGNGRMDPGERPVPDVSVRIGPMSAVSDSGGYYRIWDVLPFDPVAIQVDSATFQSPLWVAPINGSLVELAPNRYLPLDIPVLTGGAVDGRLVSDARGTRLPLGGLRVLLRERRSGDQRALTTFADGTFNTFAMRPGEWEAVADSAALEALGLEAPVVVFTLKPTADGDFVGDVEVVAHPLVPRRRVAPGAVGPLPWRDIRGPLALRTPTLYDATPAKDPVQWRKRSAVKVGLPAKGGRSFGKRPAAKPVARPVAKPVARPARPAARLKAGKSAGAGTSAKGARR